ncbi:MAG: DUF4349 domain-containing protein [Chloroflexi bacterium]|nr:DUF4349 domain-containing protein [Chloroflexota bacterium]
MKKTLMILAVLLLLVAGLAACSPARTPEKGIPSPTVPTAPSFPAPVVVQQEGAFGRGGAVAPTPAPAFPPTVITADQQLDAERKIVRTGNVALVVEDVPSAIEQISGMAVSFNGFVVSSNVFGERDRLFGSISIRIAAERFDDAIRALRTLAVDVTNETTNSRDVTEEFVDLSAQLKNLEATEAQLLKILEKAETVEDTLNVQRELSRVRSDIERTKGRLQFLERTSSTSLIDISLQQSKLNLEFKASRTTAKEREEIQFAADVSGGFAPYSFHWELGDGTTSTEVFVSHAYRNDGKYTVTLTVTDDRGNKVTETRSDYITIIPGWNPGDIVGNAWDGLVAFGQGLANVIIYLVIFIPVWLVVGGIAIAVFVRYRRRQKKIQ